MHLARQAGSAEHNDEAMLFDRLDEDFDAGNFDLPQTNRQRSAFFAADAAGATVADLAGGIERAEIAARCHVVRSQLKADAGGFQRAAADDVFERIVTEESEVTGSAAGSDTGLDGDAAPLHTAAGQGVEIRRARGFQFGQSTRFQGETAQAVGHEHHNFRVAFLHQFPGQSVHIHKEAFRSLNVARRFLLLVAKSGLSTSRNPGPATLARIS